MSSRRPARPTLQDAIDAPERHKPRQRRAQTKEDVDCRREGEAGREQTRGERTSPTTPETNLEKPYVSGNTDEITPIAVMSMFRSGAATIAAPVCRLSCARGSTPSRR